MVPTLPTTKGGGLHSQSDHCQLVGACIQCTHILYTWDRVMLVNLLRLTCVLTVHVQQLLQHTQGTLALFVYMYMMQLGARSIIHVCTVCYLLM